MTTKTLTRQPRQTEPDDLLESDEFGSLSESESTTASGSKRKRRSGATQKKKDAIVPITPRPKSKSKDSGLVAKPSAVAPKQRSKSGLGKAERTDIKSFREAFGLTLDEFAKILGSTSRSVSGWEQGAPMSPLAERMFLEVKALIERLSAFADPEQFRDWLRRKNDNFEGFSPIDLIQAGKMYRLWELVFRIEGCDPM